MNTANVSAKLNHLHIRSQLLRTIREFFYKNGFIEVETPVRVKAPALEEYIDAVRSEDFYLRTSPELQMKRLIQAGITRIFQIGPCFRRHERGKIHRPEFTMLEWYMADADYREILLQTQHLIQEIFWQIHHNSRWSYQTFFIDVRPPWDELSVKDAFTNYGRVDLDSALANNRVDLELVENIESKLGINKPTILIDYPVELGALARRKPSNKNLAERWELYIGGMELANAYSELTDVEEQRQRFESCARSRRAQNREVYPIDDGFLQALQWGMPECAGCALGIDRLLMILTNSPAIDDVLFF